MDRCHIAIEILLAILLPPLGVCLRYGCCTWEVLICLLLTLLGYIPGIIYAVYIIVVKGDGNQQLSDQAEAYYRQLPE